MKNIVIALALGAASLSASGIASAADIQRGA